MLSLNNRNPFISGTWKNMKTFLFIIIAFLIGMLMMDHRETLDYSSFDSMIVQAQRIQDSAMIELKKMQSLNDSLMLTKFGK